MASILTILGFKHLIYIFKEIDESVFLNEMNKCIKKSNYFFYDAHRSAISIPIGNDNEKLTGYISEGKFKLKRKRSFTNFLFAYSTAIGEIESVNGGIIIKGVVKASSFVIFFRCLWCLFWALFSTGAPNLFITIMFVLIGIVPVFRIIYESKLLKKTLENEINKISL